MEVGGEVDESNNGPATELLQHEKSWLKVACISRAVLAWLLVANDRLLSLEWRDSIKHNAKWFQIRLEHGVKAACLCCAVTQASSRSSLDDQVPQIHAGSVHDPTPHGCNHVINGRRLLDNTCAILLLCIDLQAASVLLSLRLAVAAPQGLADRSSPKSLARTACSSCREASMKAGQFKMHPVRVT